MKKYSIVILTIFLAINLHAQNFAFDNKYYTTISWDEFFKRLDANPNLIFFDIRTDGERADTSQYTSYNQGKIKGALETDFANFDKYYPEYLKLKNDTIYLYCSHSRRSRRLAKRLADSSFVNIVSINGGMSHFNSFPHRYRKAKSKYYSNNLSYNLVSPKEFKTALKNKKIQIIDVRPDSIYHGISLEEWENSFGKINNVMHIPYDKIQDHLHLIDMSKEILLFDNFSEYAPKAAQILNEKGYKTNVLLFGLDNLTTYLESTDRKFLQIKYRMITPTELLKKSHKNKTTIIDVRTPAEYQSIDTISWKNVGRIKNAINIPLSEITKDKLEVYKNNNIILYDIMMHDELYEYAKKMKEFGFENFELLVGGIFQIKWEINNTAKEELKVLIEENKMP